MTKVTGKERGMKYSFMFKFQQQHDPFDYFKPKSLKPALKVQKFKPCANTFNIGVKETSQQSKFQITSPQTLQF